MAKAVTTREAGYQVLSDPRFAKDIRHWEDYRQGRIPPDWPLLFIVAGKGLLTTDGDTHRRLRQPIQRAISPRRVKELLPDVEAVARRLLAGLATVPAGEETDLQARFALPLPLEVICSLLGVPEEGGLREELHELSAAAMNSELGADAILHTVGQRFPATLLSLIERKRSRGDRDDLTMELVDALDAGRLTEEEVIGNLVVTVIGGHETTVNLICHAVRGLLTHPETLAEVRARQAAGDDPWPEVVEEALRWESPSRNVMFRYATEDITVEGGAVIHKGEAVLVPLPAIQRCPHAFPDPDRFDPGRAENAQHLAFGAGAHRCPGASLARAEAAIALRLLFETFPELALAPRPAERVPSLGINGYRALPVFLRPAP
ncbi:cytochrome P450 [Streptomyces litchfieldiae]|uniref:Cytochrome P450 n=1 Tax=Streptomyces litchfieldiae TaxID=3075543 RepID=A0ABU2MU86_9ACTN|nr:cytochrome P450 [Streptomyces sp. DSM 44938]MDT0345100.1 cytochrome P450 [Streptomyces sp. DSM 44938]